MPKVTKKNEYESIESMLRRFKKAVANSGILNDLREKEFYEKPTAARKKARQLGIKRGLKRLSDEKAALKELRRGAKDK